MFLTPSCETLFLLLFSVCVLGILDNQPVVCPCEERFLERIQDLEKKVNDMYLSTDKLTNRMIKTIDSVDKLLAIGVSGSSSQTAKQRQIVSFTVKASKNMPFLLESDILKFDEVLVNNGGAYDSHSGVFTSPTDGVYLFATSILSGFNSTIETAITLNGHDVSRVYSGAFNNRGFGSNTVILNLRKGDEVAVAVFYGRDPEVQQWVDPVLMSVKTFTTERHQYFEREYSEFAEGVLFYHVTFNEGSHPLAVIKWALHFDLSQKAEN